MDFKGLQLRPPVNSFPYSRCVHGKHLFRTFVFWMSIQIFWPTLHLGCPTDFVAQHHAICKSTNCQPSSWLCPGCDSVKLCRLGKLSDSRHVWMFFNVRNSSLPRDNWLLEHHSKTAGPDIQLTILFPMQWGSEYQTIWVLKWLKPVRPWNCQISNAI